MPDYIVIEAPSKREVYKAGSAGEIVAYAKENIISATHWFYDVLRDGLFMDDLSAFVERYKEDDDEL